MKVLRKDPDAILDYGFDWSGWLPTGVTISASTWAVPSGITEESSSNTTTTTTIVLSGGTDRKSYILTNHIVASDGKEDDRSMKINVRQR